MKFINTEGIPLPLLKALTDDIYNRDVKEFFGSFPEAVRRQHERFHLSVTGLARSPRQRLLEIRHHDKMVAEPKDRYWSMFGKTVHSILEGFPEPGDMHEKRTGITVTLKEIGDVYIHGCADRITGPQSTERPYLLQDYKFTKVGALQYDKSDYHMQLNVLAYLFNKNNIRIDPPYSNVYLFKDWDERYAKHNPNYPSNPWLVSEVRECDEDEVEFYIESRAFNHFIHTNTPDDELPFCDDKELWRSLPQHKVFKIDPKTREPQKKSKFKANSLTECKDWIRGEGAVLDAKGKGSEYVIDTIPPIARKCKYCPCSQLNPKTGKHFCNQYAEEIKKNRPTGDEEENE